MGLVQMTEEDSLALLTRNRELFLSLRDRVAGRGPCVLALTVHEHATLQLALHVTHCVIHRLALKGEDDPEIEDSIRKTIDAIDDRIERQRRGDQT